MDREAAPGNSGPRPRPRPRKWRDIAPVIAALIVFVGGLAVVSGAQFAVLVTALIIDGALAAGWFAAAAGYGAWIGRAVWGEQRCITGAMAMGCGTLLMAAWCCAWAGGLNVYVAWGLLVVGWIALVTALGKRRIAKPQAAGGIMWIIVPVAAVVALMIGAAMVAPGILWRPSEAGGYDVLEYHLQLPVEWLATGAMRGLHHNAYSYLPNLVEAGFLQLSVIKGGVAQAALCCQLLCAGFALLAAGAIGETVWRWLGESEPRRAVFATAAAGLSLVLPWTVVTGSMAYDEQAVQLFVAAAMGVVILSDPAQGLGRPWAGFGAGVLVGFACLAKLTSVGLVGLPVVGLILVWRSKRWRHLMWFVIGAAGPVAIYMVRNALWTGDPVFPMLTGLFGTAHWTAEQAARWQAAHQPGMPIVERLARLWEMVLAHPQYAFILWSTAGVAVVGMIADNVLRRVGAALAVMIGLGGLFWLFATHDESRFALPLVVPACVAIGMGLSLVRTRWVRIVVIAALVVWPGAMSWRLWFMQSEAAPLLIDGVALMQQRMMPYELLNGQLAGAKVYAEGWATPLYVTDQRRLNYHTVWDRSELGELMDKHGVRGALAALGREGYGYLLIDRGMIARWMRAGNYGYDPSVTAERLREIERTGLPRVYDDQRVVVYQLP